jgi:hypothetical protein
MQLLKTINRYLTAIADQQIIDQRIKELFEIEKEVAARQALLGDAKGEILQTLTRSEQIKLLKALVIQKVANGESAEEAITVLAVLEDRPPHAIKHDHLYNVPVLSEVADILKMATIVGLMITGTSLVALAVNPRLCGEWNGSQFCNQTRSVYRYFVEPKGE